MINKEHEIKRMLRGFEGSFLEINQKLNDFGFYLEEEDLDIDVIKKRPELYYFKKIEDGELSIIFKYRVKGICYSAETPVPKTLEELEIQITWVSDIVLE